MDRAHRRLAAGVAAALILLAAAGSAAARSPKICPNNGGGAGGGGLSSGSRRPPWQGGLAIPGNRRTVPDVSAHASMLPGWPVELGGNWLEDGGTSASSRWSRAPSRVERQRACRQKTATGPRQRAPHTLSPDTLFDIVSGANGYNPGVPGISAAPGYDMASGLGVPRFDRLAATLPLPAP